MKKQISNIKIALKNNIKVIENYSFMTILQIANVLIGLVTYPYVIRTLGTETYGLYVFVLSSSVLLGAFISFSTDLLGTKEIAQNVDDLQKKSEIVSSVVFVRLFLFGIAFVVLLLLSLIFGFVLEHLLLYVLCFLGNIGSILFHDWYFQGVQKMKIVTYIKIGFNLLQLPFIFLFISSENDLLLYAIIMLLSNILGALYGFFHLLVVEKIKIIWVGFDAVKQRLKVSLPFFYTTILVVVKQQMIPQILGTFIGMHEVALFDLAQKIWKIPDALTLGINKAFFPKFANSISPRIIDKLLKNEFILGIFCILCVIVFGKFAVYVLGGEMMSESYYILIILSINILTYLLIGVYLYFAFVLNDKNDLLFKNQAVALISFAFIAFIGLYFYQSIYVFAIALVLSGGAELLFCYWNYKKMKNVE